MSLFDRIRATYPHLGLALYALEPGQPVSLEVMTPNGDVHSYQGPTAEIVLRAVFSEVDEQATPDPPTEPDTGNVFD